MTWAAFRAKFVGSTNPAAAEPSSLRGLMFHRWAELGLASQPTTTDNGVHASAGPVEAMAERHIWLGTPLTSDVFGKALLSAGATESLLQQLAANEVVAIGAKKGPAFDLTEDMQSSVVIGTLLSKSSDEISDGRSFRAYLRYDVSAARPSSKELCKAEHDSHANNLRSIAKNYCAAMSAPPHPPIAQRRQWKPSVSDPVLAKQHRNHLSKLSKIKSEGVRSELIERSYSPPRLGNVTAVDGEYDTDFRSCSRGGLEARASRLAYNNYKMLREKMTKRIESQNLINRKFIAACKPCVPTAADLLRGERARLRLVRQIERGPQSSRWYHSEHAVLSEQRVEQSVSDTKDHPRVREEDAIKKGASTPRNTVADDASPIPPMPPVAPPRLHTYRPVRPPAFADIVSGRIHLSSLKGVE
jgi:hypothetical protein